MLVATVVISQRTRVEGVPQGGAVVSSGETTARAVRAPQVPTPRGGPASGPAAGEIPSDEHLDVSANVPAVTNLDPALRQALGAAETVMRSNGIQLWITSGWRTTAYQQRLYDEAVAQHGVEYARTHVATPDKTEHTKGEAVDIAPTAADKWLILHGAQFGLCQTYANEIWHFELTAKDGQCPAMRTDALG
ncbi:MAG TPA: M15 family metallopeptidase [Flexivirga sp.]|uniref:M15 family metallopeptidase n=1 Tax=Flexivirga sp. TaxID=1962927 RepID=UPI002BB1EC3F|nr:M15 family metallopeptidase [Flexivirga sp.]HWC22468.1 M15 family metallopeptidase [Flexivirga sp.]